jgi:hypothetical protein
VKIVQFSHGALNRYLKVIDVFTGFNYNGVTDQHYKMHTTKERTCEEVQLCPIMESAKGSNSATIASHS